MEATRYTLETIAPLFLRSPNGDAAELRPLSFKVMLRYWWRALHPMATSRLREEEKKRFGSETGEETRPPLQLRLQNRDLGEGSFKSVPFSQTGFEPGQTFDLVTIVFMKGKAYEEEIDATLRLMLMLGGVGNRSRRGFGSLRLAKMDGSKMRGADQEPIEDPLEAVCDQLSRLEISHRRDGQKIELLHENREAEDTDAGGTPEYPWVKSIRSGPLHRSWQGAIGAITKAAHRHDSSYTGDVGNNLSSLEYVTLGSDGNRCWPIVTSLHLPGSTARKISGRPDRREEFREALQKTD